ncbi:MAG: metallophosphoesterase [Intestinibacter sp.]|uniref:metallophosphoesterase n=1 Tax=Intestinibacter sp. TaxID=1965304 RepID=UPI002A83C435|nr:metallophosphoesterase [Intestinibacter sp.]MDY4575558.1 metallophosphoesterase [Intestinibacter sp.]
MDKIIFVVICILIAFYFFIKYNVNTLETKEYIIQNEKIPKEFDGYSIVQVSDLHSKSFGKNNERLLKKISELKPEIVVITGDLVDGENNNYDVALDFMAKLVESYRVYYIIGNHEQKSLIKKYKEEYKEMYFKRLHEMNFANLDNAKVEI